MNAVILHCLHHAGVNLRGGKQRVSVLVVERRRHRHRRGRDTGKATFHLSGLLFLAHVPQHTVGRHGVNFGRFVAARVAHAGDNIVHTLVQHTLHAVVVAREVVGTVALQQGLQIGDQVLGVAVVAHRVPTQ